MGHKNIVIMILVFLFVVGCAGRRGVQTEPDKTIYALNNDTLNNVFTELGMDRNTVYFFGGIGYDISSEYPPSVQVYHIKLFAGTGESLHFYIGFKNDEFKVMSIVYRKLLESSHFKDRWKLLHKNDISIEFMNLLMEIHEIHKNKYNESRKAAQKRKDQK